MAEDWSPYRKENARDKKEVEEGDAGEYVRTAGQAENKADREEKRAAGKKGRQGRRQKEPDAG